MKKMVCEICGSNEIEKKDGVFVCNSCGTRYSTEEAKKLLVEVSGKVEVSGSVKVDNSDRLANLYNNARNARNALNFEEAAKYYDYILMEDSDSWEANFFSVYCKAFSCKIAQIGAYAILVANNFPGVLKLIKENVPQSNWNSTVKELATLLDALYRELIKGSYDFHKPYFDFVSIANDGFKCCDGAAACGDAIDSAFKGNQAVQKNAITLWNTCIFLCDGLIDLRPSKLDPYTLTAASRNSYRGVMNTYQDKISRVSDPEGYRRRQEEAKRQAEEEARKRQEAEAEKKRQQEEADRIRREAWEAKQPKTEEERLQMELKKKRIKIAVAIAAVLLTALFIVVNSRNVSETGKKNAAALVGQSFDDMAYNDYYSVSFDSGGKCRLMKEEYAWNDDGDLNIKGTYTVRGDKLTMQFDDFSVELKIETYDGEPHVLTGEIQGVPVELLIESN